MVWRVVMFVWHFLASWAGASLALLAALYYGPRKMLETWDWYVYRFRDSAIFEIIDQPKVYEQTHGGRKYTNITGGNLAYSAQEIGHELNRTEASVLKSLRRLKRDKKAVEKNGGWYSAETAPKH